LTRTYGRSKRSISRSELFDNDDIDNDDYMGKRETNDDIATVIDDTADILDRLTDSQLSSLLTTSQKVISKDVYEQQAFLMTLVSAYNKCAQSIPFDKRAFLMHYLRQIERYNNEEDK
jgi:hypothetical protein